MVPGGNPFYANGFVLIGYTQYGIRFWQHVATGAFYRRGEADMLPPSQQRHMFVCEQYLGGAPVEAGEAPKPWLTDDDILQLVKFDLEDFKIWLPHQGVSE